jgi:hypothetical protein
MSYSEDVPELKLRHLRLFFDIPRSESGPLSTATLSIRSDGYTTKMVIEKGETTCINSETRRVSSGTVSGYHFYGKQSLFELLAQLLPERVSVELRDELSGSTTVITDERLPGYMSSFADYAKADLAGESTSADGRKLLESIPTMTKVCLYEGDKMLHRIEVDIASRDRKRKLD